jgi:hypothetical protein
MINVKYSHALHLMEFVHTSIVVFLVPQYRVIFQKQVVYSGLDLQQETYRNNFGF